MIHLLLTSELPWQRMDAITFFTFLCISRYQKETPELSETPADVRAYCSHVKMYCKEGTSVVLSSTALHSNR